MGFVPIITPFRIMLGVFTISVNFGVIFVFTSESFPTEYRGTAFSVVNTLGRMGAIIAPMVADGLSGGTGPISAMMVYAIVGLLSCLLLIGVEETKGRAAA